MGVTCQGQTDPTHLLQHGIVIAAVYRLVPGVHLQGGGEGG